MNRLTFLCCILVSGGELAFGKQIALSELQAILSNVGLKGPTSNLTAIQIMHADLFFRAYFTSRTSLSVPYNVKFPEPLLFIFTWDLSKSTMHEIYNKFNPQETKHTPESPNHIYSNPDFDEADALFKTFKGSKFENILQGFLKTHKAEIPEDFVLKTARVEYDFVKVTELGQNAETKPKIYARFQVIGFTDK